MDTEVLEVAQSSVGINPLDLVRAGRLVHDANSIFIYTSVVTSVIMFC